jgi:hypothetical protein
MIFNSDFGMEVRYTVFQTFCGLVFGIVVARYFGAEWWGYVLAIPTSGALAFYLSLWKLRSLGLKPDTMLIDFIEECRNRWDPQRQRKTLTDYIDELRHRWKR